MTLPGFLLLLLTAVIMAGANVLMKTGIERAGGFSASFSALLALAAQPRFTIGFLLSGVAALMWFRVLATQKLSTCYPLFVGMTFSLIALGSLYWLHENVSAQKLAGLGIIILGIAVVARS